MSEQLTPGTLRVSNWQDTMVPGELQEFIDEHADAWEADLARLQNQVERLEGGIGSAMTEIDFHKTHATEGGTMHGVLTQVQEALTAAQEEE